MTGPLLASKLRVPHRRRVVVGRSRLSDVLSRGVGSGLVLVSAPAGFGKTTVLAHWLAGWQGGAAGVDRSVAWVSLDRRDNDPAVFWSYVVAAIEEAAPGVGAGAVAQLQDAGAPAEVVLTSLINALHSVAGEVVLVLDDYHLIDSPAVQAGMEFLVEHLPPQLHLVIAGRADPALPLARLRGRGELVEIRAGDLRFTPEEASAYLTEAMGLALTASDVEALEERTEGWIAALQLAALSIQGRDDVAGFIEGFAGDDRYIIDYLVEEVLGRQPGPVREFLLQTSVLSRMCGSLCDAVTGRDGGQARLVALERANLFLVPLDDRRAWYRYHHLFAEVLQVHLREERSDVSELHRRASAWFSDNGDPVEAIRHSLAAGDAGRAADLIELAMPSTSRARQEATLRGWLEALPDELIRAHPVLSNGYAGSLLVRGEIDGVESRLGAAEAWLEPSTSTRSGEMIVADEAGFRRLPGAVAVHRAGLARMLGDLPGTISHARRALGLLAEDDLVGRGAAACLLGLAHWTTGDLASAHQGFAEGMANLERAGYLPDVVAGAIALADLRIAQGQLRAAMATYQRGLRRATEEGGAVLRGAADMHVGIGELLREHNDLDGARHHLERARELGDHLGMPQFPYRWRVAMAGLRAARGDLAGALDLLDEAERVYAGDFFPEVRPIAAMRARILVEQGRWGEAREWALGRGLSIEDELSYLQEYEHVTLARIGLAQPAAGAAEKAAGLLARLLPAAEAGGRQGSVIEVLVLQATACRAGGDARAALVPLDRALTLAEPEGYVRVFADVGAALAPLLRTLPRRGTGVEHLRRIQAATHLDGSAPPAAPGMIEPLSDREADVLRLLATDLSGPDIARELVVSLHTVRTHTQHIYAKLGVNNRRAAIRRAGELGLAPRVRER